MRGNEDRRSFSEKLRGCLEVERAIGLSEVRRVLPHPRRCAGCVCTPWFRQSMVWNHSRAICTRPPRYSWVDLAADCSPTYSRRTILLSLLSPQFVPNSIRYRQPSGPNSRSIGRLNFVPGMNRCIWVIWLS